MSTLSSTLSEQQNDRALAAKLVRFCEQLATNGSSESPGQLLTRIHSTTDQLLSRITSLRHTSVIASPSPAPSPVSPLPLFEEMLSTTQLLNSFSGQLYKQSNSVTLYRAFRKVYEGFTAVSVRLRQLTGDDKFNELKRRYSREQLRLFGEVQLGSDREDEYERQMQEIIEENKSMRLMLKKYEEELQNRESMLHSTPHSNTADQAELFQQNIRLKEQVQQLEQALIDNNDQFAVEIQKYNKILTEQREQILSCEKQHRKIEEFEFMLHDLHAELQRNKEDRFKDQLMIENMTRKIRNYERQLASASYLSPNRDRTADRIQKQRSTTQHVSPCSRSMTKAFP